MLRRITLVTVAATGTALVVAVPAFADDRGPHMMYGDHRDGFRPFWWLCLLVVIGATVAITWFAARRGPAAPTAGPVAPPAPPAAPSPTAGAEAIIAERLARGEITPDDYRSMLAALREPAGGAPPAAS